MPESLVIQYVHNITEASFLTAPVPGKPCRINLLFDIFPVDPRFRDGHLAAALEAADCPLVFIHLAAATALELEVLILENPL